MTYSFTHFRNVKCLVRDWLGTLAVDPAEYPEEEEEGGEGGDAAGGEGLVLLDERNCCALKSC